MATINTDWELKIIQLSGTGSEQTIYECPSNTVALVGFLLHNGIAASGFDLYRYTSAGVLTAITVNASTISDSHLTGENGGDRYKVLSPYGNGETSGAHDWLFPGEKITFNATGSTNKMRAGIWHRSVTVS